MILMIVIFPISMMIGLLSLSIYMDIKHGYFRNILQIPKMKGWDLVNNIIDVLLHEMNRVWTVLASGAASLIMGALILLLIKAS